MYYKSEHTTDTSITIRLARPEDAAAIRTLAERDSADVPAGSLLIGSVDGEILVAVSIFGGDAVSDPFRPTAGLLGLVSARAAQLRGEGHGLRGRLGRVLGRRGSRGRLSPQPAGTMRAFD